MRLGFLTVVLVSSIFTYGYISYSDVMINVANVRNSAKVDSYFMRAANQGLSIAQINLNVTEDEISNLIKHMNSSQYGKTAGKEYTEIKEIKFFDDRGTEVEPQNLATTVRERDTLCCEVTGKFAIEGKLIKDNIKRKSCGRVIRFKPTK